MFCSVLLLAALAPAADPAPQDRPTADYTKKEVAGFTVYVSPDALAHEKELTAATDELKAQLEAAAKVVRKENFESLKRFPVWVEWKVGKNRAAEFHNSADWLKANGYNPDKVAAMEISDPKNFVSWSRSAQPWMVLHELAHGYHIHILGRDHKGVKEAYAQAKERKLYEAVKYIKGGEKRKAYALTNDAEYFAELTEAYFGKNDFYPFTRDELKEHDPVGFKLMQDVWETDPPKKK